MQMEFFTPLLAYALIVMISAWIIDLFYDIQSLTDYVMLGSITASIVIVLKYWASIETTIFLAILGIFTLLAGMVTDRPRTRIIGLTTMLATALKGAADVVSFLEKMAIAGSLKVAIVSLFLGLTFLGISYIYLKFYKRIVYWRRRPEGEAAILSIQETAPSSDE